MVSEQEVIESCACHKVRMAARVVTRTYDEALRPTGLRATQLAVLVAVALADAISITSLAKALGMDRSSLTRTLGPIEKDGLVVRSTEGWRRSRSLRITPKGRAVMRDALPLWEKAQSNLQRKLGHADWSLVTDGLDRLIRAGQE
jgi:DNA-binding MarR family transcriptional regulator